MKRLFFILFALLLVPASGACAGWWNLAASSGGAQCAANSFTNVIAYSRDIPSGITAANWTQTGTVDANYNQVGLEGSANTATILTDNAAALEYVNQNYVAALNNLPRVLRVFVKKDTDETRFVFLGFAHGVSSYWHINTKTGASIAWAGGANDASATIEVNSWEFNTDWWEVLIFMDAVADSTTTQVYIIPADGTVFGTRSNAATGSAIIGNVELYPNKQGADIRGLCPDFNP